MLHRILQRRGALCVFLVIFKNQNECFSLFKSLVIDYNTDYTSSEGNHSPTGSTEQYKEQL